MDERQRMETGESQDGYAFFDLKPPATDMLEEVLSGLSGTPKNLAPKYFYDEQGSRLFEAITRLEEYYLTRTEMMLFDRHQADIARAMGHGGCIVEYGSGSSTKIRKLLENVRPRAYVPVDISREHLQDNARQLHRDFPWLKVYPVCADISEPFSLPEVVGGLATVGFFPGSSIGNFNPQEAQQFLSNVRRTLGSAGQLLVGVDNKKDKTILEAAYNDREGITAQFNLNVLSHLNAALGSDFHLDKFTHCATYNEAEGCVQMFLQSRCAQTVTIGDQQIEFAEGELLHTENSYKYHPDEFSRLARAGGFEVKNVWTDDRHWFSVFLLRVARDVS